MVSETLLARVRQRARDADDLDLVLAAVAVGEELTCEADDLVGYFVEEARKLGRSWTEIGQRLGVSKQAVRKRFSRGAEFPMQPRLQRCLDQAAEEARLDGSPEVSSLHLLLGLLHEGVASVVLERLGVTEEHLRSAVRAQLGSAGQPSDERPPFSEAANEAVDCAIGWCKDRGSRVVGTEHLLFVLATEVGSRTRKLLESLGVSVAAVKRELVCFVEGQPPGRKRRRRGKRLEVGSCSFCGKPEQAARGMVAGPGVSICADCVTLSREVLDVQAETGISERRF
jgi:ClpX C4-type zinc finger/Clp amino terminal domain, pathogenicity island component